MLIIRLVLIVGLGLLQGACSWDVLRPKPAHAPDVLDEQTKARETDQIDEVEVYNRTTLQKRKFDKPVMKALPHANAGLLGDILLSGNDNVAQPSSTASAKSPAKQVEFDFKDIELRDLLALFFDEYLKKPYTYLDDFKDKKVNFVFHGKVTHEELLSIFEVFLNFHGVSLKFNQGVYAITTTTNTLLSLPASGGVGDTVGIFKLRYMNAQDFYNAASLLLADKGVTSAKVLDESNTVFVKASQAEVAAVKQLSQSLDVAFFEDKYLLIYGPQYLKVSAAKVLIEKYEHSLGSKAQHPKKRLEVETLVEESRLVIVAADKEARELVIQFLASVDKPGRSERQMFQYPLSSQKATEAKTTLDNLLRASTKNTEPVDVVEDKLTNSLFIMATAEEFAEISKLLHELDFRIPAVHIDFVVAEVALTDKIGYGVEWFLSQQAGNLLGDQTLDMMKNAAVAGATGGLSLGAVALNSNKFAALKLLASTENFKMLSNPHLLVKNGSPASINVGSNIAVPASTTELGSAGTLANTTNTKTNYTREDVSLKMEITPQISMEGVIQLTINMEDKSLAGIDADKNPTFLKRDLKTELVIEDNQTVLLGGLIRNGQKKVVSKVPWLGDVPYLGAIFSNNNDQQDVTELFMLITPRLVLDSEGAQLVTKALTDSSRDLLKGLDKKPPLADLDLQ